MNKTLVLTKEYPPHVYGGAGVHVENLTRELAKLTDVEVRCFGEQSVREDGVPEAHGFSIDDARLADLDPKLRKAVDPLAVNLEMISQPIDASLVHCHTWYSMMAGVWAKELY
ncbi:MAG: glycosyltransferase, partial [Planctomycetota bacterium]